MTAIKGIVALDVDAARANLDEAYRLRNEVRD
jgi:hypothetical protein